MIKIYKTNRILSIRTAFLITLLFAFGIKLSSQDKIVNFQINRYWGGVSEQGAKTSFSHPNLKLFADYAAYGARLQGGETNFGGFITITQINWTDPNGIVIDTAVFTPSNSYLPNGKVISPLEYYVRYNNPTYNVEQKDIGPIITDLGAVDPSKCIGTSDQSIIVTNEYANGIQVQRKILGWSQQCLDNFIVVDMTFTNKSDKFVTGMYVSIQDQTNYNNMADGHRPSIAAVDQKKDSKWYHYIGSKTSDSVRVMYEYDADDPNKPGDQMGQPLTQQYGRLLRKDFAFTATLWASKQAYTPSGIMVENHDQNDADDMSQPSVAVPANLQNVLNLPLYPLNDPKQKDWYDFISGSMLSYVDQTGPDIRPGHFRQNLDDLGVVTPGGQPGMSAYADQFESMCLSYGPYNLQPGQQLRIVKAMGYAGLSREKALEVGRQWLEGTLTDPMPNKPNGHYPDNFAFPAGTTQQDKFKDKWLSTGIDSVVLTAKRAVYNFLSGYKAPVTPPPPTSFKVLGTGQGIELTWANTEAEAMSGFQGYRILRKVGNIDTTFYEQIATIPASEKGTTHTYVDMNILFGAQYYYYIQAGVKIDANDQNAYPADRGKTIWTGRIWFPQNTWTTGKRASQDDLRQIVIAPNPYNYNDHKLKGYGFTDDRGILFFNLPIEVTIKIFTEAGNLVKTIEHYEPITKAGSDEWDMTNENSQPIASGIYIVLFQTPDGSLSYQKLVVAR